VLGAGSFYQGSCRVHGQLLLGEEHLLLTMEQAHSETRVRKATDDSLLSVDTFHSCCPGLPISPELFRIAVFLTICCLEGYFTQLRHSKIDRSETVRVVRLSVCRTPTSPKRSEIERAAC